MKTFSTSVMCLIALGLLSSCGGANTTVEKDIGSEVDGGGDQTVFDTPIFPDVFSELPDFVDIFKDVPDAGNPEVPVDLVELEVIEPGSFGYPCEENGDCLSGFCVETWQGKVCSQTCVEECPDGWRCSLIVNSCPDCQYICTPKFVNPCQPFKDNNESGGDLDETGQQSIDYGPFGKFCGGECWWDTDCPKDYICDDFDFGGQVIGQCIPESGVCQCSNLSVKQGRTTVCYLQNEFGTCHGHKECTVEGLWECDAPTPVPEQCNGEDDDCDGLIDENKTQMDCESGNAWGICRGTYL